MENPITAARRELNLSVKEFALLVEVVEVTLRTNEKGESLNITPKILNFLVEQGFDREKIIEDYEKFKQWRVSEISKKMKSKR